MNTKQELLSVLAAIGLCIPAGAQTIVAEIEPNGSKAEATLASGLVAGDKLTGLSTGSSALGGLTTAVTADTWRVRTGALPLGIYRHTLLITTSGTAGHTGTIRGLNQTAGVIGTTDSDFQISSATTAVPRSNTWYGFGQQEEIYWRVAGNPATTGSYTATLSTIPITPVQVAGTFNPGQIVISTYQQTHTSDTEIYLYDASLHPVPLGHNDGTQISGIGPSILTMHNLPAGTYYVAVGEYNTANNLSDLNPDDPFTDEALLDFPNALCTSRTSTNLEVSFSVTDGPHTTQHTAIKVNSFDVYWARITVGSSSPTAVYCFGDGSGTACPCGNAGATGNGCASSLNPNGGHLAGSGVASIASDSFVISGSGLSSSSALYFQGTVRTALGAGAAFGDGLRCASGTVTRLGLKISTGGTSSYPVAGDAPISVKGHVAAGNVRMYQGWYRNAAAFCTASTFNLTNGLEVTWTP